MITFFHTLLLARVVHESRNIYIYEYSAMRDGEPSPWCLMLVGFKLMAIGQVERFHRTVREQAQKVFESEWRCIPYEAVVHVVQARDELMRVEGVSLAVLICGKLPRAPPNAGRLHSITSCQCGGQCVDVTCHHFSDVLRAGRLSLPRRRKRQVAPPLTTTRRTVGDHVCWDGPNTT